MRELERQFGGLKEQTLRPNQRLFLDTICTVVQEEDITQLGITR
ncbi:hypothetical protein HmCmsJML016_04506 [Escherichia coli]|nr:hypothetical protein HmCmsJML016_04506 [Escherichia coli]